MKKLKEMYNNMTNKNKAMLITIAIVVFFVTYLFFFFTRPVDTFVITLIIGFIGFVIFMINFLYEMVLDAVSKK